MKVWETVAVLIFLGMVVLLVGTVAVAKGQVSDIPGSPYVNTPDGGMAMKQPGSPYVVPLQDNRPRYPGQGPTGQRREPMSGPDPGVGYDQAAKEAGQRSGAEADPKMRKQKKARKRGEAKQAHKGNQDYMEKARIGQVAAPKDMGNPNYCVSQAVKQDRRRVFTASELKHYDKGGEYSDEPFWVQEQDGALMLVDPLIYPKMR